MIALGCVILTYCLICVIMLGCLATACGFRRVVSTFLVYGLLVLVSWVICLWPVCVVLELVAVPALISTRRSIILGC